MKQALLALAMLLMVGSFPQHSLIQPKLLGFRSTSPTCINNGLTVVKTCPGSAGDGETFECTFTVTNDSNCDITNLIVRNYVPYPQDTTGSAPIPCGTGSLLDGESCSGSFNETVNYCVGGVFVDRLTAVAAGGPGVGSITGDDIETVTVPTCTPTSTPTNTPTPTPTPTNTPGPFGLSAAKFCPPSANAGETVSCTFIITNLSHSETVNNLLVYSVVNPGPSQTINGPLDCFISGIVTSLGPAGGGSSQCTGTVTEVMPACNNVTSLIVSDFISATGDASGNTRFGSSETVNVTLNACTPTPTITNTPAAGTPSVTPTVTRTPTLTPTVTPTGNTPTPTVTPTRTPTGTITPTLPPTVTRTRTPSPTPTSGTAVTPTRTRTPTASCGTILTGTIRNAAGSPLAINGVVWFELSGNANATCCTPPFQVGPAPPVTFTLTNGKIIGAALLIGNDCLTSGPGAGQANTTCYLETVIDTNGTVVLRKNVYVSGVTQNVGTLPSCVPRSR